MQELDEHYSQYTRDDYLSPVTISRYNDILDEFEPYKKTNKILDIGCGIGYFLDEAKKRGWKVYGTEFTDDVLQILNNKDINTHKGILDANNYEAESFDIITSFEVIEHIDYPMQELSNISKILRKGGLVYLTTPNFNSFSRYYLKDGWIAGLGIPDHLSYYSARTIRNLFKNNGYSKLKIETTGLSIMGLKQQIHTSASEAINSESDDELLRQKMESSRMMGLAKRLINFILSTFNLGDTIKATFIKQ